MSRTRLISSELAAAGNNIRIVGLSASVANAKDLGAWIGANGPTQLFHFHPNVRYTVFAALRIGMPIGWDGILR